MSIYIIIKIYCKNTVNHYQIRGGTNLRKLLTAVLSLSILLASVPVVQLPNRVNAAEAFEITSPTENQLVAAGHFDITWSDSSDSVKEYDVYINNRLVATTTETEYEHYTTEVTMHSVFIVAENEDGSIRETEKVTFGITKKGLAVNDTMGKYLDANSMNVGWYYNWGTSPNGYSDFEGVEFVPMIWGTMYDSKIPTVAEQGYKYLLSYNEPDMGFEGGGCNTDVQTVINHWPKFLGYDFYLSAPAPALSPSWDSGTMFRTFMDSIDHDTVDFIPLHCYYGTWGGVEAAESFLETVVDATYEMYGKPIWITEFAISGWDYSKEWARDYIEEFMIAVMEGLDERSYVERYSWFSFDTTDGYSGASALWTNSTGELTELGKAYAEHGNPQPYTATESTQTTLLSDSVMIGNVVYEDYANGEGVVVTASSEANDLNVARNIIDSDIESRWESEQGIDSQSVIIDLGAIRNIKQLEIVWDSASAKDYTVEVSEDGVNYTTVATIENGTSTQNRLDTIVLAQMAVGRYVKVNGTARSSEYGYSIYDVAIYGAENENPTVEILGFQYNTTNDGFRVISAVEPEINGQKVVESGNIYGIDFDTLLKEDMKIDNVGTYVKKIEATSGGISDEKYSDSDTANSYIMTMIDNGMSAKELSHKYMVRSYAVLQDGTVVYSDVEEFSIVDIAEYLYLNKKMSTAEEHDYLYSKILTVVHQEYEIIKF